LGVIVVAGTVEWPSTLCRNSGRVGIILHDWHVAVVHGKVRGRYTGIVWVLIVTVFLAIKYNEWSSSRDGVFICAGREYE
jgi:hypothetical protein